jgi:hypothetical protein
MFFQGLDLPSAASTPVTSPSASESPVVAPSRAESSSQDAREIELLKQFFEENRPENVPRAAELFGKMGHRIWEGLESKYPGKTAAFLKVC